MIAEARVTTVPKDENAVDIFKGDWSTPVGQNLSAFRNGDLNAFPDPRLVWGCSEMGVLSATMCSSLVHLRRLIAVS